MMNHATTRIFFDNLEVPVENLVGEEGQGFRYILDGLNAERILIASECIGDARWFLERNAAMRMSAKCSAGRSGKIRACNSPSRADMPTWERPG